MDLITAMANSGLDWDKIDEIRAKYPDFASALPEIHSHIESHNAAKSAEYKRHNATNKKPALVKLWQSQFSETETRDINCIFSLLSGMIAAAALFCFGMAYILGAIMG